MAKVYITEYVDAGGGPFNATAPSIAPVVEQTPITSSGSSQQSAAFNAKTNRIRVHTDGIISFQVGANPTASTSTSRMAANATEYFAVSPGAKIAVITNT